MSDNLDPTKNQENQKLESTSTSVNSISDSTPEIPVRKELTLSYISINFLKETAKWAKFISIVGFVLIGLMVIIGLLLGTVMTAFSAMIPSDLPEGTPNPAAFSWIFSAIYIIISGIYFFPVYYLFNFSSKLKSAINSNSQIKLEESFKNLKSHYKFMGIFLIIGIVIYASMFLFIGGMGLLAGTMF